MSKQSAIVVLCVVLGILAIVLAFPDALFGQEVLEESATQPPGNDLLELEIEQLRRMPVAPALAEAIRRTRGAPLLLVGETPGFATRGATINFYLDTDRTVGFEINVDATAQRKLCVDARLLKLARIVRNIPQPNGNG